jgi:hypothetical protein
MGGQPQAKNQACKNLTLRPPTSDQESPTRQIRALALSKTAL